MTTSNRVFLTFFLLFAAINLVDFAFYGASHRNLLGAAGFGLMAYGCWKDTRAISAIGAVLALGSILVKYWT